MKQERYTMAAGQRRGFAANPTRRNGSAGKRSAPRGHYKPGRTQGGPRRADTRVDPRSSFARYQALAQAADRSGDAIAAENYYQHADHYYRVMAEQAQ